MLENTRLIDLISGHQGKAIDKWEQYVEVYEQELADFIRTERPVRLLEIGVQNGGSLELWKKVLPEGSEVRGLDIDARISELEFEPGIRADIADATDPEQLKQALGGETFDIIIDDGSHRCSDVREAFTHLFGRLRLGGRYIVEDLHCSYYASFGGGLREPTSSIEFIKSLIDCMHADYIDPNVVGAEQADKWTSNKRVLAKVAFYDSVAVIAKLDAIKERPYRRLLSGDATAIQPMSAWIRTYPVAQLQQLLFGDAAFHHFEKAVFEELEEKRAATDRLGKQVAALEAEVLKLKALARGEGPAGSAD